MTPTSVGPLAGSAVRVRIPLRRPFVTAVGCWTTRDAWILRLRDPDGRTGLGEVSLDPAATMEELDALAAEMSQALEAITEGRDPEQLVVDEALAAPIRAGLEAALIGCGRATIPGGIEAYGIAVPLNATIGGGTTDATVAEARAAVAAGYTSLKLKGEGGATVHALVEHVVAVRVAVGPSVGLRLDVNGEWDLETARVALHAMEAFDLEYIEQPLPPHESEIAALADLRRRFRVRIAVDESVGDLASARAIVDAGAADVLVLKPARLGGIRAAVAVADLAAAAGVGTVVSNLLETGVGVAAGLALAATLDRRAAHGRRLAHGLATAHLLATDLLADELIVGDGQLESRDLTGLTLDDRAVRTYAVDGIGEPW